MRVVNIPDPQGSEHKGLLGLYESGFRRFKTLFYALTVIPLYILGCLILGLSILPGIEAYRFIKWITQNSHWLIQDLGLAVGIAVGFTLYGLTIIFIVPAINFILRTSPKPSRGSYYSVAFLPWYIHNTLAYIVRYTFLEFLTPTPFNIMYFRLMGMKIGKGAHINSTNISDPALIEIGSYVTIGGSATICAHYGMDGYLVLSPVKIGDKVTVGLKASIMGGVTIGEGAKILPHSVVLPKTVIPPGEVWGGVPAVKVKG